MRKLGYAAVAAGMMMMAAAAHAGPVVKFKPGTTPGSAPPPAYIGVVPPVTGGVYFVENFSDSPTNGTVYSPTTNGESVGVNSNARLYSSDVSGEAIGPPAGSGGFLSILNGTYSIDFTKTIGAAHVLSFLIGGLDAYNSVTFHFTNNTSYSLYGGQIIAGLSGNQGDGAGSTGRVTYDFGTLGLSSVDFGSSQAAFELDSIVAAAPEPATWAMMIFGFGMVGGTLRRRRREGKHAFA